METFEQEKLILKKVINIEHLIQKKIRPRQTSDTGNLEQGEIVSKKIWR